MSRLEAIYPQKGGQRVIPSHRHVGFLFSRFTVAVAFVVAAGALALMIVGGNQMALFVVIAAIAGGYMALNIGANDVANNVGPAVGSGALTLGAAIAIAAVFESAGAILAGGDVVSTISKGIIDPSLIPDARTFMLAMGSALLAGALWLNLATWIGAPVSTTHAIVGGVLGGGVAAAGLGIVDWGVMSKIAASWFISPVLGGLSAAALLALLEKTVFSQQDKIAASRRWVPVFLSIMVGAFSLYLMMKGFKKVWKPDLWLVMSLSIGAATVASFVLRPLVERASLQLANRRKAVNGLFNIPLIFSVALLSFAHGANDVANAVGPLAAIVNAASSASFSAKVSIPLWVMAIGASGISLGLLLFGAKLIRTVGQQLTKLDQARAFCVCLAAAVTVISASALGLPVSSTHIAIGSVFGIGFYREFRGDSKHRARPGVRAHLGRIGKRVLRTKWMPTPMPVDAKFKPRKLVRRRALFTIAAAWFITVPCAAAIAAALFHIAQAFAG